MASSDGVRRIADARRWIGLHCAGTFEMLMEVHAFQEDTEGAIDAEQLDVAVDTARGTLLALLGIRSLVSGNNLPQADDPLYDPLQNALGEDVDRFLSVHQQFQHAKDQESAHTALIALRGYVRDTEIMLGFQEPLLSIRSPRGFFPALRIAQNAVAQMDEAGLPSFFPASWRQPPASDA